MRTDRCDLRNISQINLSGHGLRRETKEWPEHLPPSLSLSPSHTLQGQMWLATHSVFDKHCSSLCSLLFSHSVCLSLFWLAHFSGLYRWLLWQGHSKNTNWALLNQLETKHSSLIGRDSKQIILVCLTSFCSVWSFAKKKCFLRSRLYLYGGSGGEVGWGDFEWRCPQAEGQLWNRQRKHKQLNLQQYDL